MPKALLSVVLGDTPAVRGAVVDGLLRLSPRPVLLAVTIEARDAGYPVVQRFLSGAGAPAGETSLSATGDPVVILRQDLFHLRRLGAAHIVLALPEDIDALPFLIELWRARVASGSLGDHFAAAGVTVGVDPASFTVDIGCVHRGVRLWSGGDRGEPLTPAEVAVRRVEAADALVVPAPADGTDDGRVSETVALAAHLNAHARLVALGPGGELPDELARPLPSGTEERWRARWEPVAVPRAGRDADGGMTSVLWRARRPLHPERLADALPEVMWRVVRGSGHLWLCSRPDAVVTWRSAGGHLELKEADRWLEPADTDAWEAASPQRRTLASWFWDDYVGERRNEITLTGPGLDPEAIHRALNAALLTDAELSLGREGWTAVPDPLLGDVDLR
ncbi:cobalamin synthesis CobW domain-containing protein [Streptomyces lincolnensis]|uniref:Cobalamin synthesis CobW domain-containing protein n=1 Tax=Streptomyces lincolnensis TaxID=1915 RepID=A0A1B1M3P4_STRLN|nr:GTP-binding protein [Streptomyces lincolnensis]ANS63265.1 cobalamin synthesis CobW domain-containing protein [Streptomyces lincolnensis]AXG52188.1 cobalamin synthesis CobW domain-containing protein [Streptomyces lincolnensis]